MPYLQRLTVVTGQGTVPACRLPTMTRLAALLLCPLLATSSFGADAILKHKASLRGDPSATHPPVSILAPPDEVELISLSPTRGYYQVRTVDGQEGWIYGRSLQIVPDSPTVTPASVPPGPGTPVAPGGETVAGVSSSIPANWDKPQPNRTQFEGLDGACGPTGDGGDAVTNSRKNRTDVPASYHEILWKALQSLPYPNAARSLMQWTPPQLAVIQPYDGVAVSVVGYLAAIKVEDKGSGESTNCHFTNGEEVDWHMPLLERPGDAEATSIVVETTPRVRQTHPKWSPTGLAPWVSSASPVRVSGWAMLDPEHRAHLGKLRSTLWEVHPVMQIEVFKDGQWLDADQLP
jgi:hypothetical protein